MRQSKGFKPVADVLAQVLGENASLARLEREERLRRDWPAVVGARVAKAASVESIAGEKLILRVCNPVWKTELGLQKEALLRKVNEHLGGAGLRELVLRQE